MGTVGQAKDRTHIWDCEACGKFHLQVAGSVLSFDRSEFSNFVNSAIACLSEIQKPIEFVTGKGFSVDEVLQAGKSSTVH